MNKVTITLDGTHTVRGIENNHETEQYRKVDAHVGQKLPKQLVALFLMNPHRFEIKRTRKK